MHAEYVILLSFSLDREADSISIHSQFFRKKDEFKIASGI